MDSGSLRDPTSLHGIGDARPAARERSRESGSSSSGSSRSSAKGSIRGAIRSSRHSSHRRQSRCEKYCRRCFGFFSKSNHVIRDLKKIEDKMQHTSKHRSRWQWVHSFRANLAFSALIFLNTACIGIDIETSDEDGNSLPVMVVIESLFLAIFWIELILRILASGPRRFCRDPWGPFDTAVTLLGSIDAWVLTPFFGSSEVLSGLSVLRTLRIMRIARLLRVFRNFKQLTTLVKILSGAFKALSWVSLLLFMAVYFFVIVTLTLLKGQIDSDSSPELVRLNKGFGWTLFYHVMVVTCEGYLEYLVQPTVKLNLFWYVYWTVAIIVLNFFMVNLMVGIIVQRTLVNEEEEDEEMLNFVYDADAFKRTLLTLFEISDANQDGVLNTAELVPMIQSDSMMEIFRTFGIRTDVPLEFLVALLGFQHQRYVTFKRFYDACVRVCGASRDVRAFMLQHDVTQMTEQVSKQINGMLADLGGKAHHTPRQSQLLVLPEGVTRQFSPESDLSPQFLAASPQLLAPSPPARAVPAPGTLVDAAKTMGTPPSLVAAVPSGALPVRAALPLKGAATASHSKPAAVCGASLGSGFSDEFSAKAQLAKKRLSLLERRQEEMLLTLGELRKALLGNSGSVCCPNGHLLMPLGTNAHPVGAAEYRHWSCNAANETGACRSGPIAGSHLTKWRRYHCATCRYDLCEVCYQHRLWGGEPPPKPSGLAMKPSLAASPVPKPPMCEPPRPLLPTGGTRV